MKINIKAGGMVYSVEFSISPGSSETHLTAIAKSSKDLDELQTAIINRGGNDETIGGIWRQARSGTSIMAAFTKMSLHKLILFHDAKSRKDYLAASWILQTALDGLQKKMYLSFFNE